MERFTEHRAMVVDVTGSHARVKLAGSEVDACGGCRMSAVCSPDALMAADVDVPANIAVLPGDLVKIGFSEGLTRTAILLLLVAPLLGLILGVVAGTAIGSDIFAAVGGLVGALLAFGVVKLFGNSIESKSRWRVISKI